MLLFSHLNYFTSHFILNLCVLVICFTDRVIIFWIRWSFALFWIGGSNRLRWIMGLNGLLFVILIWFRIQKIISSCPGGLWAFFFNLEWFHSLRQSTLLAIASFSLTTLTLFNFLKICGEISLTSFYLWTNNLWRSLIVLLFYQWNISPNCACSIHWRHSYTIGIFKTWYLDTNFCLSHHVAWSTSWFLRKTDFIC